MSEKHYPDEIHPLHECEVCRILWEQAQIDLMTRQAQGGEA